MYKQGILYEIKPLSISNCVQMFLETCKDTNLEIQDITDLILKDMNFKDEIYLDRQGLGLKEKNQLTEDIRRKQIASYIKG